MKRKEILRNKKAEAFCCFPLRTHFCFQTARKSWPETGECLVKRFPHKHRNTAGQGKDSSSTFGLIFTRHVKSFTRRVKKFTRRVKSFTRRVKTN